MEDYRKKQSRNGNVLCKLAVLFAPQASEFCIGSYYQPKKPDNMEDFVAKCGKKNI